MRVIGLLMGMVAAEACVMHLNVGGVACEAVKARPCSELTEYPKYLQMTFKAAPKCVQGSDGISCDVRATAQKADIRAWFDKNQWVTKCCLKT
ncbi:hypothetical protein BGZ88_003964, partial [Linnemannia elongata]